jgi:hypothetical protein
MKVLFFLAALAVVGLVVTGAIHFQKSGNTISIQIDKDRVEEDAQKAIGESEQVLHEAEARLQQPADQK